MVVLAGLNVPVTPVGSPETERFTGPEKPFFGVIVRVTELPAPGLIGSVGADAAIVKLGGAAVRVSPTVAVECMLPDAPSIVRVAGWKEALLAQVSVRVLVVVALAGLNAAVTPLGNPETVRLTAPEKPFFGVTVNVTELFPPELIESVEEDAANVNEGAVADPSRSSIRLWPVGLPQPVARS